MSTRSQRIALLLVSGTLAVLVVTVVPWCYYGVSPTPVACLSRPGVHDWSLKGPGGRYGITETGGFRRTGRGIEKDTLTRIWLGPLGQFAVPVRAPVAALGFMGSSILLFGLCLYGIFKPRDEKQTV
jgi:hypothetical protein